jgi:hypothetical protein
MSAAEKSAMSPHCPQHALPAPTYQYKGQSALITSHGILIADYVHAALRHTTNLLSVSVKQLLPNLHHLFDKNWHKA